MAEQDKQVASEMAEQDHFLGYMLHAQILGSAQAGQDQWK